MRVECKKCDKQLELSEGVMDEQMIANLRVFLKKHRKHGIFVWSE